MILGAYTYIRIWGLDRTQMVQVDLQMAECCLLDLPTNLFANANPLSKQIRVFSGPRKIPEQSKMLTECPLFGTSMDFCPHALASTLCMFRVWQEKTECNDLFQGFRRDPAAT